MEIGADCGEEKEAAIEEALAPVGFAATWDEEEAVWAQPVEAGNPKSKTAEAALKGRENMNDFMVLVLSV